LARKEADRFNHNFVGTEHLLLGLIKLGQGVAVNVLQKLGLDLDEKRFEDGASAISAIAAGEIDLEIVDPDEGRG